MFAAKFPRVNFWSAAIFHAGKMYAFGSVLSTMVLCLATAVPYILSEHPENFMESRIFDGAVTVLSTDGNHSETFSAGEQVRNIRRIGKRVMFEPVSPHRIAGTYAMERGQFELFTTVVLEASA